MTPDFWRPTVNDVVGHPFFRIRAGGLALKWLLSPIALALVCGVCVYWAVVGKDDQADEAEDSDEDGDAEDTESGDSDGDNEAVDEDAREPEPILTR
jgi:hypothetical protein